MVIKNIPLEDIPQVILLEEETLGESLGKDLLTDCINNPLIKVLGYYDNLKLIGYISATVNAGLVDIINFAVRKEYQRQGIGDILFNHLIVDSENITTITLEVRESNIPAINFYKKHGLIIGNVRKKYYSNGEDAYLMVKELL